MIIIPAIDIQSGQCVRLLQGRKDDATVFSDDPAAMARRWAEAGAQLIHVVDLDGAFEKSPRNTVAIHAILDSVDVAVQVGGGIRDEQTIQKYLDAGVARVVIGTAAVRDPDRVRAICNRFPGRIVLGIDARNGMVAIEGWTETTRIRAVDLARRFEDSPVAAINFTDIHRDGMQTGVNIEKPAEWHSQFRFRWWLPAGFPRWRIFTSFCRWGDGRVRRDCRSGPLCRYAGSETGHRQCQRLSRPCSRKRPASLKNT